MMKLDLQRFGGRGKRYKPKSGGKEKFDPIKYPRQNKRKNA